MSRPFHARRERERERESRLRGRKVGRKGERNETRRWGSDRRETYFFIITPTKLIFLTHRVGFQMVASPPFPSPPFLPPFSRSLPPLYLLAFLDKKNLTPNSSFPFCTRALYCREARSLPRPLVKEETRDLGTRTNR